ncbi:hypothetical protein KC19_3G159300 [Ceratodon purpureus]|uniref:Uncharacterized protein n=1 Tax=Ceratodon purpureus TaxID=3225 RepID=A0A8T0IL29_CERPU|nr:hypothetical protein KC19_3G159300 [Ceratodon purpureus]
MAVSPHQKQQNHRNNNNNSSDGDGDGDGDGDWGLALPVAIHETLGVITFSFAWGPIHEHWEVGEDHLDLPLQDQPSQGPPLCLPCPRCPSPCPTCATKSGCPESLANSLHFSPHPQTRHCLQTQHS